MGEQPRPGGTRTLLTDDVPARLGRPWWRNMAIGGVLFVVVLATGLVLGLTGHHSSSTKAKGPSVPHPAPGVSVPPTTGAGGSAASAQSLRMVDGIPVGYPQTQAGAVTAAVNDEIARSSPAYFTDKTVRDRILNVIMTQAAAPGQISRDDDVIAAFANNIGLNDSNKTDLVSRAAAMGTKVDSYTPQVAVVELWMAGLTGLVSDSSPLPVTASWDTYTLTMQWENGDWKTASITTTPGPVPMQTGDQYPSPVYVFRDTNQGFDAPPYAG